MQRKLNYIDSLRGIAVLGVILAHIGTVFLTGVSHTIAGYGTKGVQLFFFISAFTLFLSANRRTNGENHPTINFFIRRIFRIAPMYYIGILFYALVKSYIEHNPIQTNGILLNLTFVHGFSPYYINNIVPGGWTIGVEMLFYLLVPFLVSVITSFEKSIVFLIVTLAIRDIFQVILMHNPFHVPDKLWEAYLYWFLPNQLPNFAFGIIFYFLTVQAWQKSIFMADFKFFLKCTMVLLVLFLIDKFYFRVQIFNADFAFEIIFLATALLLNSFSLKFIVNKFTELVGRLSFSMYLIHFEVLDLIKKNYSIVIKQHDGLFTWLCLYLAVVALTMIFSYLTYKFIELTAQNVGKKIIKKLEVRALETNAIPE
jgi:peptidoglycan/LPS O-acetylase OafA/YrhL